MKFVVAVIVILACLFVIPGQAASGIIRIFAITQSSVSVDMGSEGRSAGDQSITGFLLTTRNGKTIGYASVICTAVGKTLPGTVSMCQGSYILPRGRIIAQGTRQRRDYFALAITGGTGIYSSAGGILISSTVAIRPRRDRLFFSLE
jgi:hypothetical protein